MSDSMSQSKRVLIVVASFLITFVIFLYSSFPYGVLKEYISAQVNSATDIGLHIGELSPGFPLGLELRDVKFGGRLSEAVELSEIDVDISLLSLLTGRIGIQASVVGKKNQGRLALESSLPIGGLISGEPIPDSVYLDSQSFAIGPLLNYLLKQQSVDPRANPMLKDLLSKISVSGKLNAAIRIEVDPTNPRESSGDVDIKLVNSKVFFDEELSIGTQQFKKASLKLDVKEGKVNVDSSSGLLSKELQLDLSGRIDLKESFARSNLNVSLKVKLQGQLKDNFGLILTALSQGRAIDGSMALQISGPMSSPNVVSL